jgi:hypothetical protein
MGAVRGGALHHQNFISRPANSRVAIDPNKTVRRNSVVPELDQPSRPRRCGRHGRLPAKQKFTIIGPDGLC